MELYLDENIKHFIECYKIHDVSGISKMFEREYFNIQKLDEYKNLFTEAIEYAFIHKRSDVKNTYIYLDYCKIHYCRYIIPIVFELACKYEDMNTIDTINKTGLDRYVTYKKGIDSTTNETLKEKMTFYMTQSSQQKKYDSITPSTTSELSTTSTTSELSTTSTTSELSTTSTTSESFGIRSPTSFVRTSLLLSWDGSPTISDVYSSPKVANYRSISQIFDLVKSNDNSI
jgi:hypothetical protein